MVNVFAFFACVGLGAPLVGVRDRLHLLAG